MVFLTNGSRFLDPRPCLLGRPNCIMNNKKIISIYQCPPVAENILLEEGGQRVITA